MTTGECVSLPLLLVSRAMGAACRVKHSSWWLATTSPRGTSENLGGSDWEWRLWMVDSFDYFRMSLLWRLFA